MLTEADNELLCRVGPFGEVDGYIERTNDPRIYFVIVADKTNDYFRDLDDVSFDRVSAASVLIPDEVDCKAYGKLAGSADSGEWPGPCP